MADDVVSFWKRVNSLIKSRKTKQEAIAAQCNISYQTLRGWVANKRYPGTPETHRIAQALGTTVEYLVSGTEPETSRKYIDRLEAIKDLINKPL
jgi:transcriptional regulator with XRE-family HTH domain